MCTCKSGYKEIGINTLKCEPICDYSCEVIFKNEIL